MAIFALLLLVLQYFIHHRI